VIPSCLCTCDCVYVYSAIDFNQLTHSHKMCYLRTPHIITFNGCGGHVDY
jgi:hypothetical protein